MFIFGLKNMYIYNLTRNNKVKTVFRPMRKIHQYFRSAKDAGDLLSLEGVYRVPCSCDQVYIGTIKRSVNTHIMEYKQCCRLDQHWQNMHLRMQITIFYSKKPKFCPRH